MKRKLTLKNLVISMIVFYCIFSFVDQRFKMKRINEDLRKTNIELEAIKQKNQKLQDEVNLSKTDLYSEKLSRERLGYVKPGETPVIDSKK
ncbi:FtsB family cell division protein [Desnuesiella massiliensis]|uniref:FtsB family cell division protein n=1 Tax=Desnuesiella massiliensis TaxID=1650662 RepID=UPI0006E2085C|nr:septum formation initiator family protein [Desnuesiella massiliensis]